MFKVAINSDVEQKEKPSLKDRTVKAFSPNVVGAGIDALLAGAANLENHYVNQAAPVGEMLADYAIKDLDKKGLKYQYYQSPKRSNLFDSKHFKDLSAVLFAPFTPGPATYINSANRNPDGSLPTLTKEEITAAFGSPRAESIGSELRGIASPDKLTKGRLSDAKWFKLLGKIGDTYGFNSNNNFTEQGAAAAEAMLKMDTEAVKDLDGVIVAPRNNQRALAHEFGHAYDTLDTVNPPKSKLMQNIKGFSKNVKSLISEPLISNLPDSVKVKLDSFLSKIPNQSVRSLTTSGLGLTNTLPGTMVNATKLLNVINPELSSKLEEKDPTGLVKFINNNPALAATIANIPHALDEMSTTIPGTKLIYNFWKDFNAGKLNDHVFARDVANVVGKKSPTWEAMKFLGKNVLTTAAPIYAPLIALYAYNKYKNRDEGLSQTV